ncbi:hypothetical protein [Mycobacterium decipiens]|uniref:hypothetical protein n=1 Tax=Mycobacterium decipiens TaxID=1430326 RepID=UPI001A985DB2|nr:hypothetical protein [Mycobacterium decipiens]
MAVVGSAAIIASAPVHATGVAHLVNETVRPGYNSGGRGQGYADLVGDNKADFNTSDEFPTSYPISQAVG